MTKEERANVIKGLVHYQGQWMPVERKLDHEAKRRKKIEEGLVFFNSEWMTIEEKLNIVSPPKNAPAKAAPAQPQQVTINKQVYNVQYHTDNRTVTENTHEHKHVHVDSADLAARIQAEGDPRIAPDDPAGLVNTRQFDALENKQKKKPQLPPNIQGRIPAPKDVDAEDVSED